MSSPPVSSAIFAQVVAMVRASATSDSFYSPLSVTHGGARRNAILPTVSVPDHPSSRSQNVRVFSVSSLPPSISFQASRATRSSRQR